MTGSARWLFVLAVTGCASGGIGGGRSPTVLPVGVYRVSERVQQTQPPVTIEGTITILPDTLMVDLTPGPCTPTPSSSTAFYVRCAEVTYIFEKRDPLQYNSYAVKTTATVKEQRCLQYVANRCVQVETVLKEQNATRTGRLRPQLRGKS